MGRGRLAEFPAPRPVLCAPPGAPRVRVLRGTVSPACLWLYSAFFATGVVHQGDGAVQVPPAPAEPRPLGLGTCCDTSPYPQRKSNGGAGGACLCTAGGPRKLASCQFSFPHPAPARVTLLISCRGSLRSGTFLLSFKFRSKFGVALTCRRANHPRATGHRDRFNNVHRGKPGGGEGRRPVPSTRFLET